MLWIQIQYLEFGFGYRVLAQFGSGSRVILLILKEKIDENFLKNDVFSQLSHWIVI